MAIKLTELDSDFRASVAALVKACAARGVVMVPYDGVRTPWQQAKYWRQSRSITEITAAIAMLRDQGAAFLAGVLEEVGPQNGDPVTRVLPGNSWHQWGEAIDSFWEVDGTSEWSTTKKVGGVNGYRVYAEEAVKLGLDPGLFWSTFKDSPHVQKRNTANPRAAGLSWAEIDQAMRERFASAPSVSSFAAMGFLGMSSPAEDLPVPSYRAPEGWTVHETTDVSACVFRAPMAICCDGAAKAYHADDHLALDYLANAGRPGHWYGIVTDGANGTGTPYTQKATDPAPGYYVSATALQNSGFEIRDPRCYIDAVTVPYMVLPGGRFGQFAHPKAPRLGDVGVIYNITNGKAVYAQFAEIGPSDKLGEASVAAAEALGVDSDPKGGGTSRRDLLYVVFPGSGIGAGLSPDDIRTRAEPLFQKWGGLARIAGCRDL